MHDTTREKKRDTKVTRERSPHVDLLWNAPESIIVQYQYRTGLKKSGIGIGIFVLKVKV